MYIKILFSGDFTSDWHDGEKSAPQQSFDHSFHYVTTTLTVRTQTHLYTSSPYGAAAGGSRYLDVICDL